MKSGPLPRRFLSRAAPRFRARPRTKGAATATLLPVAVGVTLGFVHLPFSLSWLAFLPLALVLGLIAGTASPRSAARAAFLAGLGFWSVHLFWLPQSFSSLFNPVVWLIFPLLWLAEAALWGAVGGLGRLLGRRPLPTLGTLGGLFVALEWLRAHLGPIAFPWGDFGYTLLDTPLAQVASLGGVGLASLLVVGLAAALAALAWGEARPLLAVALAWGLALTFGLIRSAPPPPTEPALLVQGNVDVLRRTRGIGEADLGIYRSLGQSAPPGALVVWPEAAVRLEDVGRGGPPRLVAGARARLADGSSQNLVAAASAGRVTGTSAKLNPVPFGEYFPLRQELAFVYDPIFRTLGLPGLPTARPGAPSAPLELGVDRVGAYVCYDSVFPDAARGLALRGANVLVNVSNDGWFGDTWGVEQHFAMGRMRAIEQDRYLLRAGNTGITAVIDPRGRVLTRLERGAPGTLEGRYGRVSGLTPYARLGDWPVPLALLAGLACTLPQRRRVFP